MNPTTRDLVTDPICGMTIDPANAAGSSSYEGETYYLCSRGCQTEFDTSPEAYATAATTPAGSASCCATDKPARAGGDGCC